MTDIEPENEPTRPSHGDVLDPDTGKVRVLADKCTTCVFRQGNLMHLEPGRLGEIIKANLEAGSLLTCHSTLPGIPADPTYRPAVCRGFWDGYHKMTITGWMAEQMLGYVEVDEPAETIHKPKTD